MNSSFLKQKAWIRLFGVLLVLVLGFGLFAGQAFADESDQIVVKLDGVDAVTYTRADLTSSFSSYQQLYSTINNWPTKKFYATDGVVLSDILDDYLDEIEAEEDIEDIYLISVKATDNLTKVFTREELLDDARYYYPNLMSGDPSGASSRDTVIALENAQGTNYGSMSEDDGLRLFMGQRAITEQNNPWLVKYVCEINLITDEPDQWDQPTSSHASGTVTAGTQVTLNHTSINGVKIYYTTDSSTPDVNSTMYNVSATYYQPELNVPITINQTTTVKAIAIGPGKTDSAVATWTYTVE